MNKLIIVGAGGYGKVLADNAIKNGYTDIYFVDDCKKGLCMDFPIVGTSSDLPNLNDGKTDFIIGIGNNATRKQIAEAYAVNWISLIHPSAQIGVEVSVGKGTAVMPGAVISACARIGNQCIVNTRAVIEHDDVIEDYVHISPNAALGGTVRIGESAWIGLGASVVNNIHICAGVTVGAGAAVIGSITESGTYAGVPARKIK